MLGILVASCVACGIIGMILLEPSGRAGPGFFLGIVLGPIGVIIAAIMRLESPVPGVTSPLALRRCPQCAEMIQPAAIKCRFCGSEVTPVVPRRPQMIRCHNCSELYAAHLTGCGVCGAAKPKNPVFV